jgi:transposase-like protein
MAGRPLEPVYPVLFLDALRVNIKRGTLRRFTTCLRFMNELKNRGVKDISD